MKKKKEKAVMEKKKTEEKNKSCFLFSINCYVGVQGSGRNKKRNSMEDGSKEKKRRGFLC